MIVDGVDNFPTRYLLNDASVRLRIPVVSRVDPRLRRPAVGLQAVRGPVLPLPVPEPPPAELAPSCGANGVLGVLPGTMGLLQATEVVKLIIGAGEPLIGRLLLYDALGATFTELKVRRDPECPICSRAAGGRSPTRRWASSRTTRRSAPRPASWCRPSMATIKIPPVLRASVGRREGGPGGRRRRRRRPAARSPSSTRARRGSCSRPTARSTATSTSTSTTRTCACSAGSTRACRSPTRW